MFYFQEEAVKIITTYSFSSIKYSQVFNLFPHLSGTE